MISFTGLDFPADIRDLTHDIKYWEWSWAHAGETTLDALSLCPLVGMLKYGDEVAVLVKNADKIEVKRIVKFTKAAQDYESGVLKVKKYIRTKIDSLFEYVKETEDLGDAIRFKTADGIAVDISKKELTEQEIKTCLNGCFTGETLVMTKEGLKRIDSIQEGELVLSKNVKTGEIGSICL